MHHRQPQVSGTGRCLRVLVLALIGAAVILWPIRAVRAQVHDDIALSQQVLSSDLFGADARALGMGNTNLALSRDGSALIYNPANLARIKRIELRAGLSHLKLDSKTRLLAGGTEFPESHDITKTKINALSLTVPVPTYRGSLVFGFGVHRLNSFDGVKGWHGRVAYGDTAQADSGRAFETGGLWKWSAAGAMDISPRLSVGLAVHLLTGRDEYRFNGTSDFSIYDPQSNATVTDPFTQTDQSNGIDFAGVSATAGLTYTLSSTLTAGLTVETPQYLTAEESGTAEEAAWWILDTLSSAYVWERQLYDSVFPTASNYTVVRPFTFGFGLAGTFGHLNAAGDLHFTDWSQTDFSYDNADLDPVLQADEAATLRFIQDDLKEALSWHLGAEYLFPEQGLTLRAGYFRDPLPVDSRFIESQRQYVTAGVGFLIDRVMTLDLAYVHGGYELRNDDPGTYFAKYKTRRVFVTFGYRI